MEVDESFGHLFFISAVSDELSGIEKVLSECDPVRDVVTAGSPLPTLNCGETISRCVTATLTAKITVGASGCDLVDSDGRGKGVDKRCFFIHCARYVVCECVRYCVIFVTYFVCLWEEGKGKWRKRERGNDRGIKRGRE